MSVSVETPVNWKITQGETFSLQLQYVDPNEIPIDISDYTIVFTVKDQPQGNLICATCTVGDGLDLSESSLGIINLNVSPNKTAVFNYPKSYYKIQATDPYLEKYVILQGWFEVRAGENV
jgi:hypothetical protein